MRGEKEKSIEKKKFALVAKFFAVTRTRLIWLNEVLARVKREEKVTLIGRIDIFNKNEPWRKKNKNVSFQSTNKESMV